MLKTQISYWEQITEMMKENYRVSLDANQQIQEMYSHMFKEAIETSMKNAKEVHEGVQSIASENLTTTMESMQKYSELFVETNKKGLGTLRSLFEKYSIDNSDFVTEMEKFWHTNTDEFQKKFKELTDSLVEEQKKNIDMHLKAYNECTKEIMEKFDAQRQDGSTVKVEEKKKKK